MTNRMLKRDIYQEMKKRSPEIEARIGLKNYKYIIFRGIKAERIKRRDSYEYKVFDASLENYTEIANNFILALIREAMVNQHIPQGYQCLANG